MSQAGAELPKRLSPFRRLFNTMCACKVPFTKEYPGFSVSLIDMALQSRYQLIVGFGSGHFTKRTGEIIFE